LQKTTEQFFQQLNEFGHEKELCFFGASQIALKIGTSSEGVGVAVFNLP